MSRHRSDITLWYTGTPPPLWRVGAPKHPAPRRRLHAGDCPAVPTCIPPAQFTGRGLGTDLAGGVHKWHTKHLKTGPLARCAMLCLPQGQSPILLQDIGGAGLTEAFPLQGVVADPLRSPPAIQSDRQRVATERVGWFDWVSFRLSSAALSCGAAPHPHVCRAVLMWTRTIPSKPVEKAQVTLSHANVAQKTLNKLVYGAGGADCSLQPHPSQ